MQDRYTWKNLESFMGKKSKENLSKWQDKPDSHTERFSIIKMSI